MVGTILFKEHKEKMELSNRMNIEKEDNQNRIKTRKKLRHQKIQIRNKHQTTETREYTDNIIKIMAKKILFTKSILRGSNNFT